MAQSVYFFVPWFWWLRRQVRLCQEYIADAAAAAEGAAPDEYAAFLVSLAKSPAAPLGAAGLGDIGSLFPSDASTPEGVSSLDLLRHALTQVRDAGYTVVNADCILVGEQPRIADRRTELERVLAEIVAAPVSVRATTTDRLGFTGRGEGLAAQAVALVEAAS